MSTAAEEAPQPRSSRGKNFRKRTPTLLQMEAVECGAAALGILMHYYGVWESLEKLRVECGVSRDGSKAGNILRVARKYGFDADGYKVEAEDLFSDPADLPCIVFWEFNHFLVIEGRRNDKVFLNDPAVGPRTVTWEEFDKKFTGVVLIIQPGAGFSKQGKKPSMLSGLFSRLGKGWSSLILIILTSLALIIPGLAAPTFSKVFVDNVMNGNMTDWLWPLLAGISATFFVQTLLSWIQSYYLTRLQTGLSIKECSRFIWHILHLPVHFFLQRYGAEIGTRISLNNQVVAFISGEFAQAIVGIITTVFYLIVMLQYSGLLTAFVVLLSLISITSMQLRWRWDTDCNMKILKEQGQLSSLSMGGVQMMQTIKACGLEDDFFSKWYGYYSRFTNIQNYTARKSQFIQTIPGVFIALNSALILIAGGLKIMSGELSIGGLLAFQILSGSFLGAVNKFVSLGQSLAAMKANVNRIEDVMAYDVDTTDTRAAEKEETQLSGNIRVENITFGYNQFEPPVISDFTLELNPGKRIALIGASGSGKSTLARIIAGLLEPWEGRVLFDGKSREHYSHASLTNSISVVDQSIFLFSDTVKNNLTLWDETIAESSIFQAARDACIHDDIINRAEGYNALIEEGGTNFSGGQRQRLEIARALCKSPNILILDEATSALDPLTENKIDNHLRRRGCSCIIVAHRLSTIRDADEIIVLDKGVVVQRGTHEEMIQDQDSYYARLVADA